MSYGHFSYYYLFKFLIAPVCNNFGRGTLYSQFSTTPTFWTKVTRSYTASYTNPVLYFGFETGTNNYHYLDDVSIVDNAIPSNELLKNPSFDNVTALAGWDQWCTSSCMTSSGMNPTQIVTGSICRSLPKQCFQADCIGLFGIVFISQSFTAIIGHTYTISFWHMHIGSGSGNEFYVDVF